MSPLPHPAGDALAKQPLNVGRAKADQIDHGAFDGYFNAAGEAFDKAAGPGAFARLPWQAQTVIADLWFNNGDLRDKKHGAPVFWEQVTTGDWDGALQNLGDFSHKDRGLARRARRNGRLLKDAMDHGELPNPPLTVPGMKPRPLPNLFMGRTPPPVLGNPEE